MRKFEFSNGHVEFSLDFIFEVAFYSHVGVCLLQGRKTVAKVNRGQKRSRCSFNLLRSARFDVVSHAVG